MSLCGQALYLNLTYRCNSRCQFCAADIAYREDPRFITMDEVNDLIGNGSYVDIFLSGGEPTLHPQILQILEACRDHSPCVTALTHGRSFHNRRYTEALLKAGLNYLIIPLYGYDAETHDSVTGTKESFDQTWKGLRNLQSFRDDVSFFVEIKLLLTRHTAGLNPQIYRLLRDHVPDAVNQISVCPLIYSLSTKDVLGRYDVRFDEVKDSFYDFIDEVRSDGLFRLRLNEFPPCFFEGEELRAFAHPQIGGQPCADTYWYGDDHSPGRVDMDGGDFVKTKKGNSLVQCCRTCRYDSYCSSVITSFFSKAYLDQRAESEFRPIAPCTSEII